MQSTLRASNASPTVMVVEDNADFAARLIKFVERRCGVSVVVTASSAEEALESVTQHCPSFILLDICMSGMSGLDAIALLRTKSPGSSIIVVSSMPAEYGTEAVDKGAVAYVRKDRVAQDVPPLLTA